MDVFSDVQILPATIPPRHDGPTELAVKSHDCEGGQNLHSMRRMGLISKIAFMKSTEQMLCSS
ncbi:MAG: hypothetical protein DWI22_14075 [Planctomycetota bacterium]|nr:MAG: hypothetical protein DWI22_14075 [Planctomycetota bacterium]